jgi:hypothetical protein
VIFAFIFDWTVVWYDQLKINVICVAFCIVFNQNFSEHWQAVAQWLRYYATSRKVAGSLPDKVIF